MSMSLGWPAWAVELVVDRESTRLGMGKEGRKHAEAGASVAGCSGTDVARDSEPGATSFWNDCEHEPRGKVWAEI